MNRLCPLVLLVLVACCARAQTSKPAWVNISDAVIQRFPDDAKSAQIAGVTVDPTTGDLYLSIAGRGFWKSADSGKTFERIDQNLMSGRCETSCALGVDSAGKRLACFMLDGNSAITLDSGKTWQPIQSNGHGWDYAAVDWTAQEPKSFLAMQHGTGELHLTLDAGATWKLSLKEGKLSAIGLFDASTLVIGDGQGIRRSVDGGQTWHRVSELRPVGRVMLVRNGLGYWLAESGLIVSKDKGATWEKQGAPVEATWGPFFGRYERHIMVAGRAGFMETTDGGVNWRVAAALPTDKSCNGAGWDPMHDFFYASPAGQGVYKLERGRMARRRVVAFGDSNTHGWTQNTVGWSDGLDRLVPGTLIVMEGQKGRRVGMGVTDIDRVLKTSGHVDEVIISLGTDDAGEERMTAAGGAEKLAEAMEQIIVQIKAYQDAPGAPAPLVTLVAPPPFGSQLNQMNREKYGANPNQSLEEMMPFYRRLALKHDIRYFDLYTPLVKDVDQLIWIDGLHYKARSTIFPKLVATFLSDTTPPAPPSELKMSEGRLTWKASPSADVLGYEVLVDGRVVATCEETSVTSVTAPAGGGAISVRARDGIGLRSEGVLVR
jgi:lysophospholipase L1-like esterase